MAKTWYLSDNWNRNIAFDVDVFIYSWLHRRVLKETPDCHVFIVYIFLQAHVRVWRADTLQTTQVLGMGQYEKAVMCMAFPKVKVSCFDFSDILYLKWTKPHTFLNHKAVECWSLSSNWFVKPVGHIKEISPQNKRIFINAIPWNQLKAYICNLLLLILSLCYQ